MTPLNHSFWDRPWPRRLREWPTENKIFSKGHLFALQANQLRILLPELTETKLNSSLDLRWPRGSWRKLDECIRLQSSKHRQSRGWGKPRWKFQDQFCSSNYRYFLVEQFSYLKRLGENCLLGHKLKSALSASNFRHIQN